MECYFCPNEDFNCSVLDKKYARKKYVNFIVLNKKCQFCFLENWHKWSNLQKCRRKFNFDIFKFNHLKMYNTVLLRCTLWFHNMYACLLLFYFLNHQLQTCTKQELQNVYSNIPIETKAKAELGIEAFQKGAQLIF